MGLPPVNSIYVHWDESTYEEPTGWYYAVVKAHVPNGTTTIEYADKATETIDLHGVKWELTRKTQKAYQLKTTSLSTEKGQRRELET